jgi:hypothetical protein
MSCPSNLWDCITYVPIVGGYFDVGKSAASAAVGSAWYDVCQSFGDAATGMLQAFAKAFAAIPDVDLASGGVKSVYGLSLGIAAIVAALLLLGQVIRTAFTHDGSPLATALVGVGKTALAFLLTLAVGTAALAASDSLTHVIITTTFGSDAELTTRLGGLLTGSLASGGLMTAAILLIFGIIGILLVIVLWFEMLLRNAAIALLIATSPIAAAGQMSESTKSWWTKLVAAAMQLIILKPVIALTFAIGLSLTGQSRSIQTLLSGMLVLLLAAFAWPVVARFFTFTSVTVGGGAGLAALVGFAAGHASGAGGGGGPSGISPAEFSQRAEARTMAGRDPAGEPAAAGLAAPGSAPASAGAATNGGGLAAGAMLGLRAAQQTLNTIAGRMEQTAGHAGIAGANPYAQPAHRSRCPPVRENRMLATPAASQATPHLPARLARQRPDRKNRIQQRSASHMNRHPRRTRPPALPSPNQTTRTVRGHDRKRHRRPRLRRLAAREGGVHLRSFRPACGPARRRGPVRDLADRHRPARRRARVLAGSGGPGHRGVRADRGPHR